MNEVQDMLDKLNATVVTTLLDPTKEIFTRGKYKDFPLIHVARIDIEYLLWLIEKSETDDETKDYVDTFLRGHLEYLEGVKGYE